MPTGRVLRNRYLQTSVTNGQAERVYKERCGLVVLARGPASRLESRLGLDQLRLEVTIRLLQGVHPLLERLDLVGELSRGGLVALVAVRRGRLATLAHLRVGGSARTRNDFDVAVRIRLVLRLGGSPLGGWSIAPDGRWRGGRESVPPVRYLLIVPEKKVAAAGNRQSLRSIDQGWYGPGRIFLPRVRLVCAGPELAALVSVGVLLGDKDARLSARGSGAVAENRACVINRDESAVSEQVLEASPVRTIRIEANVFLVLVVAAPHWFAVQGDWRLRHVARVVARSSRIDKAAAGPSLERSRFDTVPSESDVRTGAAKQLRVMRKSRCRAATGGAPSAAG